jgi:hypothetical protein
MSTLTDLINKEYEVKKMEKPYLFLDDNWIAAQSGVTRRFCQAEKEAGNPILTKGGERGIGPYSFGWAKKSPPYTAWVGSFDHDKNQYPAFFIASHDGINWDKNRTETDVFNVDVGNVQCAAYTYDTGGIHAPYPYLCAVLYRREPGIDQFHARFRRSKDGAHWEKFDEDPIWTTPGDVLHIFWDEHKKHFAAYYKIYQVLGVTASGENFHACIGSFDIKNKGNTALITGYVRTAENWDSPAVYIKDVELVYGGDDSNDGGGVPTDEKLRIRRVIGYADSADFLHWENEKIIITPPENAPLGDQGYGLTVYRRHDMYRSVSAF